MGRHGRERDTFRLWRGALGWWHLALNGVLVAAGVFYAVTWSPRALLLVVGVAVAFLPFSTARLWLEHALREHFDAPRLLPLFSGVAMLADALMVGQSLTSRTLGVHRYLIAPLRRRVARMRPATDVDQGRRQFLRQATVFGAGAPFAASVSGANISYDFRLEQYDVEVPGWPRGLDGLRVAHLSDIHVGGSMDRPRLQRVAALTNEARPDLVLHTGDFLTHRDGDFDAPLYEALSTIRAPHGQWACLGNHDFDDPRRLVRKLHGAGVRTLRNRLATVFIDGHEVEIAGTECAVGRLQWEEVVACNMKSWGPRRPVPRLLLNHDPTAFAALPEGCADLVLSGHTHGGQIGVQLGTGNAVTLVGLVGVPDQGVFNRGEMRLFVTRCVGFYGYPMRIGIPPEVALLRIRGSGSGARAA